MAQSRRLQKVLFLGLCLLVVVGVIALLFFTSKVKDFLEKQTPKDITLNYRNLGTNVFLGSISLEDLKLSSEGFELESKGIKISVLHFIPLLIKVDIVFSRLYL